MSTAIICAVLALVCVFAVRSYLKKLRNGCCGAGGDAAKRIRLSDGKGAQYPYARRLVIEGMSCQNCAVRIENAFHERDGYYAVVNLKQKTAVVRMKQLASDDELRQIVQRAGYQVVSLGPAG